MATIKSIEEKAKRYDEALKVLHKYDGANIMFSQSLKEEMFPELKESEDEKIRKELLNAFIESTDSLYMVLTPLKREAFIAWLEKQKHEEWSLYDEKILSEVFTSIEIDGYSEEKKKEIISWLQKYRPYMHEKRDEQKPDGNSEKKSEDVIEEKDMTEYNKGFECGKQRVLKYPEDFNLCKKPAWSEEDESILQGIWDEILANKHDAKEYEWKTYDKFLNWLKSIKDRVQPKQEWSEEDENCLKGLTQFFENLLDCVATEERHKENRRWLNWLKSLRPQNRWKPSEGQLECLGYAIEKAEIDWSPLTNNRVYLTLKALEEQLKKLREE